MRNGPKPQLSRFFAESRSRDRPYAKYLCRVGLHRILMPANLDRLCRSAAQNLVSRLRNSLPGSLSAAPGRQGARTRNIGNYREYLREEQRRPGPESPTGQPPWTRRCLRLKRGLERRRLTAERAEHAEPENQSLRSLRSPRLNVDSDHMNGLSHLAAPEIMPVVQHRMLRAVRGGQPM